MSDDEPKVTPRHGVPIALDEAERFLANKASVFQTLASRLQEACIVKHTLRGDKLRAYYFELAAKVTEATEDGHELRRWLREQARRGTTP